MNRLEYAPKIVGRMKNGANIYRDFLGEYYTEIVEGKTRRIKPEEDEIAERFTEVEKCRRCHLTHPTSECRIHGGTNH